MPNSKIDWTKVKRDVLSSVTLVGNGVLQQLSRADMLEIGDAVVEEMKNLISKGISPIAGNGRFPEYKGAKAKKEANKGRRKKSKLSFSTSYPFSVQRKFPGKKERPVNLFLTGKQMKGLLAKALKGRFEVGYFDTLSIDKESGHRDGVNGQPRRPTIPSDREDFSPSIYRIINAVLSDILKRKKF